MKDAAHFLFIFLLVAFFALAAVTADTETPKTELSPEVEETRIGAKPPGLIAFLSDGNVWIMDTDGKNRQMITEVQNAKGRLSFSPDNEVIAFSREGKDVNSLPSGEGGAHLLHDIFLAYIDSAATRSNWWKRITSDLGSFYPEWTKDGKYIYCQRDVNAPYVDYIVPSHQIVRLDPATSNSDYLRPDWQVCKVMMLMPTVTADGKKIAFVIRYSPEQDTYNFQNMGVKIVPMDSIAIMDEKQLKQPSKGLNKGFAPSWSPDGEWLAYVLNDMRNPGLFIVKSDLSENRLIFAPTMNQQAMPYPVGWSPDSKWIVFAANDGVIYTVDINGDNLTAITGPGPHSNPAWSK